MMTKMIMTITFEIFLLFYIVSLFHYNGIIKKKEKRKSTQINERKKVTKTKKSHFILFKNEEENLY